MAAIRTVRRIRKARDGNQEEDQIYMDLRDEKRKAYVRQRQCQPSNFLNDDQPISFTSREAIANETKCISLTLACLLFAVWKIACKKRAEKPWKKKDGERYRHARGCWRRKAKDERDLHFQSNGTRPLTKGQRADGDMYISLHIYIYRYSDNNGPVCTL